ncbi:MAG: hybrid sensor histidine kinase/response regulator, partial [Candidatus Binatia bacterium]
MGDFDVLEQRVLTTASVGRDAALTRTILEKEEIACFVCANFETLGSELEAGAGALIITEEALANDKAQILVDAVARQPAWSDLPILIVMVRGPGSPILAQAVQTLGNVT